MSQLVDVRVENLTGLLDQINEELQRSIQDVMDRSKLDKPRKVKMEIVIYPNYDTDCDQIFPQITFTVSSAHPGSSGKFGGVVQGDTIHINQLEPRNPLQNNMFSREMMKEGEKLVQDLAEMGGGALSTDQQVVEIKAKEAVNE